MMYQWTNVTVSCPLAPPFLDGMFNVFNAAKKNKICETMKKKTHRCYV